MGTFSKKVASFVSIVALMATTLGTSVASAASEFLPYAEALANKSVINTQSSEAGYRLGDKITRAELAKVAANLGSYTMTACDANLYTDVDSSLGDLCDAITTLATAGVVSTSFTKFRPNDHVTRAEMSKMVLGALGETGSSTSAGYQDVTSALGDLAGFINRANELGCARDAMYFRPNASTSRGETFKIASCAAGLNIGGGTGTGGTTPTPGDTTGSLDVSLEGKAVAQYVPMNASSVKVGSIKLTANKDVKVKTVTVNRSGLGDSQGMTIALGQGGTTVSENRSVNTSTQDAIVRLNDTLELKKGESATFDVLVSVSGTSNSQSQFTVTAVGTVDAAATVTGLPVTLGLINTTSYKVSKVTVSTVAFNGVTSGKNDQNLGRVKFQAGNRNITMKGFTLTKESGIDMTRALANVKAYKGGEEVGSVSITSDKMTVTGLDNQVDRNNTIEYELRGDVIYVGDGNANDDIKLKISETTDVSAIEDDTGYTTSVQTSTAVGTIDLSSLDIIWTKNNNKSITVAPGASDVSLFDADVKAGTEFDVTKFTLKLTPTYTGGQLNNNFTTLTLTVDGTDYDMLQKSQSAPGEYVFSATSDKFRINAGTPVTLRLKGNLSNAAATGSYQVNVTINNVKNISNGNTVTGVNKSSGNSAKVTVENATLNLKASSVAAPDSTKVYSNATDLEIGRFGLEAKAEKVTVREITLDNAGSLADFTKLVSGQNVKLVNVADNSEVSASVEVTATQIKLTGMSLSVDKDMTKNYKILVDTNSDLITEMGTDTVQLDVNVVSAYSDSTSSITAGPYTCDKTYTAALIPPALTVTKKSGTENVFVINIANQSSDDDIQINKIKVQVRPDAEDDGYSGATCFRNAGSSDTCDGSGALDAAGHGSVPGPAKMFNFVGHSLEFTVSTNSNVDKELYVDSYYNNPTSLVAEVFVVEYEVNGNVYTESYNVKSN
ncbi:hypothetical protein CSB09_01090 [Candidatus Gracilibacteria bacterium]|nr:MAG: hypothetical protein CSB09_01090 [Candidatus Gracilibacteria bacterium]